MNNSLEKDLDHIHAHTQDLWEEIRGRELFITGGTGFFGSWILESFISACERYQLDSRATVLTRDPHAFKKRLPHLAAHPRICLHAGDVTDFAYPAAKFSHIIHAATPASAQLNREDPGKMFRIILNGTDRVLELARLSEAKKFLLISSGAVYGRQPSDLSKIPEDYPGSPDPFRPQTSYGHGKRAAEHLCYLASRQFSLEAKIARCFAFLGPYQPLDAHFASGNFIRDALGKKPVRVEGDGTPRRSYLYAADLMIWLWTILFRGQVCRPYNVGSEEEISIEGLANLIASQTRTETQVLKKPEPTQAIERYIPATFRARHELGLKEWISLQEAVKRTLFWHQRSAS